MILARYFGTSLGNFDTTLINTYGNPIDHHGALDTGLDKYGSE